MIETVVIFTVVVTFSIVVLVGFTLASIGEGGT